MKQYFKDLALLASIGEMLTQEHEDVDFQGAAANALTTLLRVHSTLGEVAVKEIQSTGMRGDVRKQWIFVRALHVNNEDKMYYISVENGKVKIDL